MKKFLFGLSLAFMPSLVLAADLSTTGGTLTNAVNSFTKVVDALIPFFLAIAVVVFIYGVIMYVLKAGDPEGRKNAQGYIIYGIIGIVVILSIYGIVALIQGTLGINGGTSGTVQTPTF